MAISMIEFQGQIPRQQDFQTMKQNEDSKPMVDYSNFLNNVEKNVEKSSTQVIHREDAKLSKDREQQGSQYQGDGGKGRKRKSEERVVEKKKGSFDIRI